MISLNPDSLPPAPRNPDRYYRVLDSHKYLFKNLSADPEVVTPGTKGARASSTKNPLPTDKESRALDRFGKKVYTSATQAMRALNCQFHVMKYQQTIPDQLKHKVILQLQCYGSLQPSYSHWFCYKKACMAKETSSL